MTIYRTDINWLGFNKDYTVENGIAKAGFNNYYLPSCPDGALNVKSYGAVTFKNLYDGIDVQWYEKDGQLEYDFIVAPNSDYTKISWEIKGADRISIGENGQLIIETPLGNIEEQAPIAFQGETIVEAAWKTDGNKISFQLGDYNENEVLIIDPVVRLWGTYYGGTGDDRGYCCAADANGNVYLAGTTQSTAGIATTGAYQTTYGGVSGGFLVKFNISGVRQWGTYYGGASGQTVIGCSADASGNVYLAGTLFLNSQPNDAFLVKFNTSGVRQWITYFGGAGNNTGYSCTTDTSGNVYLTGNTGSTAGIATTGAHQTAYGGGSTDVYLVKFNISGVRQWGTYYGGTGNESGLSCATDASGNVYLSGFTYSTTGIATTTAHQTTNGGNGDAFLVKFNSSGVRQWGTYYGGISAEQSYSSAGASGNVYLSGWTQSTTGISTIGAHQTTIGGARDAFLVKFNSSGARQWGTYYGGIADESTFRSVADASGNFYLSGSTQSTTGISTTVAHQTTNGGNGDAFLVKFNSSGVRQWGNYYGGTGSEFGYGCASDASGNFYQSGITTSTTGISTTGAHQTTFGRGSGYDAFLVKFDVCTTLFGQDSITACDSYKWINGVTYTSSDTTAKDTLVASNGCDSIVSLYLTIYYTKTFTDSIIACDSYTWIDGVTYTSSDTTAIDTLVASNGCDSIVSLNLIINYTKTFTDSIVACDSYKWINGVTYTSNNTSATDTLIASNGCDSIVSLYLAMNYTKTVTDSIVACDSYKWIDGVTYTSNDTSAVSTLVTSNGCDSIVSLHLTINVINKSVLSSGDTLEALSSSSRYRWMDCMFDYSIIGGDTSQSFIAKINGSYAVEISKRGCIDTSDCYRVSTVGIDNPATFSVVTVYPNPTSGKLTIEAKNFEGVEVYDTSGRLIIKSALKRIDLEEQSKGLYLLKVNTNGVIQEFKVFKE